MFRKIVAALLAIASPGAFAINMVSNPDFDTDTNGWALSGASRDFSFGSPDNGTLRLDALSVAAVAEGTQCVDIHKWSQTGIDFVLRYFPNATAGSHQFKLDVYNAASCGGTLLDTLYPNEGTAVPVSGNPASGWLEAGDYRYALPPGALSARVDVSTTGTASGNASYLIDHVQVGPLDVIFVDNFDAD
jgi:hypothetical protein